MLRRLWLGCAGSTAAIALIAFSASAHAQSTSVLGPYSVLAERGLTPPPLVFTDGPPRLRPLARTLQLLPERKEGVYALSFAHTTRSGPPNGRVLLVRGTFRSRKRALTAYRRSGYRRRPTRVRGKAGNLMTRKQGRQVVRSLVWTEDGKVYELGSAGSAKLISLAQLRATADALEPLVGYYRGELQNERGTEIASGEALLTSSTVTARVDFTANCTDPGSTDGFPNEGRAEVSLLHRDGDGFTFDVGDTVIPDPNSTWDGTISGTIEGGTTTLDIRATGTTEGASCDSGAEVLTLKRTP
jgi:hypothetical protein